MMTNRIKSTRIAPVDVKGEHPVPTPPTAPQPLMYFPPFKGNQILPSAKSVKG